MREFEPKWPKPAEKLTNDREQLRALYAVPLEHWRHLQTTNPIQSSFAMVKLLPRVIDNRDPAPSRTRWRMFNSAVLVTRTDFPG